MLRLMILFLKYLDVSFSVYLNNKKNQTNKDTPLTKYLGAVEFNIILFCTQFLVLVNDIFRLSILLMVTYLHGEDFGNTLRNILD